MIPFTLPTVTGLEKAYLEKAINSKHLSGDGELSKSCQMWFESELPCLKSLLTPSCTSALEMAAILIDVNPGDEIIMPSYTFVSTANSFVLRGAKIVFVDIDPSTMNINADLIENAVTQNTKAIVPVHYAGVPCDMDKIMSIANKFGLYVIEDAAQAMLSKYKGRALGTIGHMGTFSFHATKNMTSGGEGGALIINDRKFVERAEIIREKGTNRAQFMDGLVDKYSWVDKGGSHLPSELQAAYLMANLKLSHEINEKRLSLWNTYFKGISRLLSNSHIEFSKHIGNGHIFYLKLKSRRERSEFKEFMLSKGVVCSPHYVPLHSSIGGKLYSTFHGKDNFSTIDSERIIRLPIYHNMTKEEQMIVVNAIREYING